MPAAHAIDGYRKTQAHASTPLERVVLLYDGMIRFIDQARAAIERRDIPARRVALNNALRIVSELQSTLDMKAGGSIATELDRLYGFITMQLLESAMKNATAPIDDAKRVIDPLRDAWHTLAAGPRPEMRA
jgi:flagellar protein FliS